MRYSALAIAYVIVHAALGWAGSGHPAVDRFLPPIALLLPAVAIVVVVIERRGDWAGCQRLFWGAFGVGMAGWVLGQIGWLIEEGVFGGASRLRWQPLLAISAGAGPLVALLAWPHRGVRASSTGHVAILLASVGLLGVFVFAYCVLVPGLHNIDTSIGLTELVQVTRVLLMASAGMGAWQARGTAWARIYLLLAAAAASGLLLRFPASYFGPADPYGDTLYPVAWVAPLLLFLAAARLAPASPPQPEMPEQPGPPPAAIAIPVLFVPLIGYGGILINPLGPPSDYIRELVTTLMTVGALGLLTLRLTAQGGALQRADARLRLLAAAIEQAAESIVITRADGTIEHANDAFLRSVGYFREELGSLTSADLMAAGFETTGGRIFAEVSERGIWRGTLLRGRRDGTAYQAACTVVALRAPSGSITHLVGIERDITDEVNLRDQLVHTERLSAIGALVAGVAHEINNPLQTILGSAEILLDEQTLPSGRRELELIRREAARAAQIVRNLLSFVRRSTPDRMHADLNEIVRATVELRQYHLERTNVTLEISLAPDTLPVFVNREEIQQIVLNLILNAEQALEPRGGGRITVRTCTVGRNQVLEVADDGPGVSRELRGRIFEPFFTTKDVGQGTGLGLSISHGIAYAHGGSLELCPQHSPGACFQLMLPADKDERTEASANVAAARPEPPGFGSALALVIDDEVPIRTLLCRLLERRGFDVIETESGEAALAIACERLPALVLCDVRMPGMSGIDLFAGACAASPELRGRFVFMSGDASHARAEGVPDDVPILSKPFTAADLDAVLEKTQI